MFKSDYPCFSDRICRDYDIEIHMEEEDKKILKEDMVDFYTLSYYMSSCVTTHENKRIVNVNILGKVKKPYLKKIDWGCQIDPKH